MKYVFGPVPSRRLGQSLGVDPIPLKTCNWNCVYCQLGRSVPLTNVRQEYFPPDEILSEIEQALNARHKIDWITFVGSGEPTLYNRLGDLVHGTRKMTDLPIAVITNGALLYLPEVRAELAEANVVMPSLDAGSPDLYKSINRPWPELTFERLVTGMTEFCKEFAGEVWVETMLISGVNDSEAALADLESALRRIQPAAVHINLPVRPPAESWVRPAKAERVARAKVIFGDIAKVVTPIDGEFDLSGAETLVEAVTAIVTRHPMREDELIHTLERWSPEEIFKVLSELERLGKAQRVKRYGVWFWSGMGSHYSKNQD
jgi:wyosine [tRNA(Phe)-imidazoG37] synthetase (radical SAM superfamily)